MASQTLKRGIAAATFYSVTARNSRSCLRPLGCVEPLKDPNLLRNEGGQAHLEGILGAMLEFSAPCFQFVVVPSISANDSYEMWLCAKALSTEEASQAILV